MIYIVAIDQNVALTFIVLMFQFWNMFDFFVRVNIFGKYKSTLLNKTSEGIFFR